MIQENIVQIWLGNFKEAKDLERYVNKQFPALLNIPKLDEDFYEFDLYSSPIDYKKAIDLHSFSGYIKLEFLSLVSKVKNRNDFNSIILFFGQKSDFGDAHLELFDYKNSLKKNAPIQHVGSVIFSTLYNK